MSVISYTFNANGNNVSNNTTHIANVNPFRYRGYYYDTETGLYYLNSRYYDPEVGRFINADDVQYLGENGDFVNYNLFAYCANNPVDCADFEGDFWNIVIGAVIGAAVSLVTSIVTEVIEGDFELKDLANIAVSTAIGAAEGAAIAICPTAAMAISAGASVLDTTINGLINGESWDTIIVDSLISGTLGAVAGSGGSDFVKGGKLMNEAADSVAALFKKGMHPNVKKAAKKCVKKAAKVIRKSYVSNQINDFAYTAPEAFCTWYAENAIQNAFAR